MKDILIGLLFEPWFLVILLLGVGTISLVWITVLKDNKLSKNYEDFRDTDV